MGNPGKLGSSAAVLVARFAAGSRTRGRCHTLQQPAVVASRCLSSLNGSSAFLRWGRRWARLNRFGGMTSGAFSRAPDVRELCLGRYGYQSHTPAGRNPQRGWAGRKK